MDIQTILVYIIVLLCVVYAGRHFLKFFKKKTKRLRMRVCGMHGMPERKTRQDTPVNPPLNPR